jgi:HD-like signal output (HDOD) protein
MVSDQPHDLDRDPPFTTSLTRKQIIAAVEKVHSLPAVPQVVSRFEEELRSASPSMDRAAKIVEEDAVVSAALLSVANSVYYKRRVEVETVKRAMVNLGLAEAGRLVIAAGLVNAYQHPGGRNPTRFWGHCLAVAFAAREVARIAVVPFSEAEISAAFTAGLLHDLGVIALFHIFPGEYEALMVQLEDKGGVATEAELAAWEIEHGEVGELLGRRWKLPEAVCQVMRCHHVPWQAPVEHRRVVQLVHLADFVCVNQGFGREESGFPSAFDHSAWDDLGLTLDEVPQLIEAVKQEGERSEVFVKAFG